MVVKDTWQCASRVLIWARSTTTWWRSRSTSQSPSNPCDTAADPPTDRRSPSNIRTRVRSSGRAPAKSDNSENTRRGNRKESGRLSSCSAIPLPFHFPVVSTSLLFYHYQQFLYTIIIIIILYEFSTPLPVVNIFTISIHYLYEFVQPVLNLFYHFLQFLYQFFRFFSNFICFLSLDSFTGCISSRRVYECIVCMEFNSVGFFLVKWT